MSTLNNITSLNLSLQTGGAAIAIKAVKSVAKPARTVYVYGTADDVAPNFTTVAGAITYANSLTPIVTEPVVVRLFTKADGTPYDLAGLSSWTTYANMYIYFVSDFVRLNETSTLPTTLPAGQQVWYIDANGVETLWVGREDGSAWPAVGYKEWVAVVNQANDDAPTATVIASTVGTVGLARGAEASYQFTNPTFLANKCLITLSPPNGAAVFFPIDGDFLYPVITDIGLGSISIETLNGDASYENPSGNNAALTNILMSIRVYP